MAKINYEELPKVIAIIGSRSFTKNWLGKQKVYNHINLFVSKTKPDTVIVSGGARGVDSWAAKIAKAQKREIIEYLPDTTKPSPFRFFARNGEIIKHVKDSNGAVMAFIDVDQCNGTSNAIRQARKLGVPVMVFHYKIDGTYIEQTDGTGL